MPYPRIDAQPDLGGEPTAAELAALARLEPVQVAELVLLDAELVLARQPRCRRSARRVYRAKLGLVATQLRLIGQLAASLTSGPLDWGEAG
jgi:hypothetical protein